MATGKSDCIDYFESLADEVRSRASRVRNLIGNSHFLSDGHHKEYVLRDIVQRHTPNAIRIARGFVRRTFPEVRVSREQDLLFADTTRSAPLFCESDFLIAHPNTVVSAVSVKSTANQKAVTDTIDSLLSACLVIKQPGSDTPHCRCFFGGFFLECDSANGETIINWFKQAYQDQVSGDCIRWSHMSTWVFAIDKVGLLTVQHQRDEASEKELDIRLYERDDSAVALFIAQLFHHITDLHEGNTDETPFYELIMSDHGRFVERVTMPISG